MMMMMMMTKKTIIMASNFQTKIRSRVVPMIMQRAVYITSEENIMFLLCVVVWEEVLLEVGMFWL